MNRRRFLKLSSGIFVPAITGYAQFPYSGVEFSKPNGPGCGSVVSAWATQVVTNGGASPSLATQNALCTFVSGLTADGVWSQMLEVNCIVPDNLTAASTPLLATFGFSLWTNSTLVSGDLSINGITGNSSNKQLTTGFNPNLHLSTANAGFTIYLYNSTSGTFSDFGDYVSASTSGFNANLRFSGTTYLQIADTDANRIQVAFPGNGYFSANRTSTTLLTGYWANSGHAHASIGTDTNTCGGSFTSNGNTPLMCQQVNGTNSNFTPNTYSFCAIHLGLTSGQSASLFSRLQTLRTTLGGGFV